MEDLPLDRISTLVPEFAVKDLPGQNTDDVSRSLALIVWPPLGYSRPVSQVNYIGLFTVQHLRAPNNNHTNRYYRNVTNLYKNMHLHGNPGSNHHHQSVLPKYRSFTASAGT